MNWGQPHFRPRVNLGGTKSVCIELDARIYDAITEICKRQNKNRAAVLRPLLAQFVAMELDKSPKSCHPSNSTLITES